MKSEAICVQFIDSPPCEMLVHGARDHARSIGQRSTAGLVVTSHAYIDALVRAKLPDRPSGLSTAERSALSLLLDAARRAR